MGLTVTQTSNKMRKAAYTALNISIISARNIIRNFFIREIGNNASSKDHGQQRDGQAEIGEELD